MPVVPTTVRTFSSSDRAAAFWRLYWGRGAKTLELPVVASVRDTDDRVVFNRRTIVTAGAPLADGWRSADYRLDLPLAEFVPGEFLLRLEAQPPGSLAVVRQVRFTVR